LNSDESRILAGAISNLQMAFVEAVREEPSNKAAIRPETPPPVEQKPRDDAGSEQTDPDGKRKFVKSYGS
jgi:hypothetical protein